MAQSSTDRPFEQSGIATLSQSDVHRLIASERRRNLLHLLEDQQTPLDLEELALLVTKHEDGIGRTEPTDVDQVAITLHHHHLPKLEEFGLIDYDHRAKWIRPTGSSQHGATEVDEIRSS